MAKMTINVNGNPIIPCGANLTAGGNVGVYELILNIGTDTGWTGISYDAEGIPDRFEVYYNNSKVIDTKFVGTTIANPSNPTGSIPLGNHILNNYAYNGSNFVNTGNTTNINITENDISDNISEPTHGSGTVLFNKLDINPTTMRIVITGSPPSGTAWRVRGICPREESSLVSGTEKFVYIMFNEANKGLTTRSTKFILDEDLNKFYINRLGEVTFNTFGFTETNSYLNDGTTWWQIDSVGNILNTGLL